MKKSLKTREALITGADQRPGGPSVISLAEYINAKAAPLKFYENLSLSEPNSEKSLKNSVQDAINEETYPEIRHFEPKDYLQDYIPNDDDFEEDVAKLTVDEKALTHAFMRALICERGKTSYASTKLSYEISDLAYSGRLGEFFQSAAVLAAKPPARAPEAPAGTDSPADEILTKYAYWIERNRMHLGVVHALEPSLYKWFFSWKRSHKLPADFDAKVPKIKEYNTRLLTASVPSDFHERVRLQRVASRRDL